MPDPGDFETYRRLEEQTASEAAARDRRRQGRRDVKRRNMGVKGYRRHRFWWLVRGAVLLAAIYVFLMVQFQS